jgi:hypothetical protein
MPFYKVNEYGPSQLSHRHPFHGFGEVTATPEGMIHGAAPQASVIKAPAGQHYTQEGRDPFDTDYRMLDRRYYNTVQGYGLDAGAVVGVAKSRVLPAAIAGLSSFLTAKMIGIHKDKSVKLGVVVGVLDLVMGVVQDALLKGAVAAPVEKTAPAPQTTPAP